MWKVLCSVICLIENNTMLALTVYLLHTHVFVTMESVALFMCTSLYLFIYLFIHIYMSQTWKLG